MNVMEPGTLEYKCLPTILPDKPAVKFAQGQVENIWWWDRFLDLKAVGQNSFQHDDLYVS